MVFVDVLTSAPLLPLVAAYQAGVNHDVRILSRLCHGPPALGGDLGHVHAVMAPWLDRVGFRFVHQLCPSLAFSYALEYGRVDLVRELMATNVLRLLDERWALHIGTWVDCLCKHRHLQYHYAFQQFVHDEGDRGSYRLMMYSDGTSISGHWRHLAVAACLGGHVDLLRFAIENDDSPVLSRLKPIALRAGRLCVVQELFERDVISVFKARDVQLAVTSGSTDLMAFLLDNSSCGMVAEAFAEATTQCQFALQWLCATYNEPLYWRIALSVAVANLQHDVIAYFATTHGLHLSSAQAARVQRRRKRIDDESPTRVTRSCN